MTKIVPRSAAPDLSKLTTKDVDDDIVQLAADHQFDPWGWVGVAYDWGHDALKGIAGPREWQDDAFDYISSRLADPETRYQPIRIAIASGHGIGKSAFIGMLIDWGLSCWDDAKIVVTANTFNQLSTKTAPEAGKWKRMSLTNGWFDTQATSITSRDKDHAKLWRCDFVPWSDNNTEAFAGLHNLGKLIIVVFDEASAISDNIWEVTEGALTDEDTVIIWVACGNPTRNTGRFRECFRRLRHRWWTKQVDSRTVPGTNKKQIDQWAQDYGEDSDFFKVRVRGMFPAASARQFISTEDVDAARERHLRPEQYSFAPIILSCDPAWTGDDELVIAMRQGLYSRILRTMPKNDNDVLIANILAQYEDELGADAVFIDMGYGTGIYSAGKTMGRTWRLVAFGGAPNDPGMANKRAEIWRDMRTWLKEGGAIPPDEVLYQDLIGPETVPRLDGKVALEPKEAMKLRGVPSPNRADAIALTFAEPVAKNFNHRPRRHEGGGPGRPERRDLDDYRLPEYEPYD